MVNIIPVRQMYITYYYDINDVTSFRRACNDSIAPRSVALVLAALFIIPLIPVPVSEVEAAGSGGRLQVSLFMANTTMLWTESRALAATVTYDGAPLMNATVNFTSENASRRYGRDAPVFRPATNVTDRDGITTTIYYPEYAYGSSDVITAHVEFPGYNATANLTVTINNPPPTVIPGTEPRNANQIAMLYGQSLMFGVLVLFVAVAFRRHRMRKMQGPG
jgi:hypothetical protein